MKTRSIAGTPVSAIGLGAMPMSLEGRPEEQRSIDTILAALDEGITLIDTADAYCINADDTGHNERLIAKALARRSGSDDVVVATKGGHVRSSDGDWLLDGRPEHLKDACEQSLKRLGVDTIFLYQYHRPDPNVAFADSVGALAELRQEGKIRLAGLSNVTVDQIEEALGIVEVASVQNELSPRFRSSRNELNFCSDNGIAFLPWSPLGGIGDAGELGRRHSVFAEIAERRGVSPQRVAVAWELGLSPAVIPIPGSTRPETIRDSAAAVELELSDDELEELDED